MSIVKSVGAGTKYSRGEPLIHNERGRVSTDPYIVWWCIRCGYNAEDPHPNMYELRNAEDGDGNRLTIIDVPWLENGQWRVHTPMFGKCGGILVPRGF